MRLNGHNWLHSAALFAQERPLRIQGGHQVRAFIHNTIKEAKVFAGIKSPQSFRLSGLSVERPKEKASKPKQVVHQEEYMEIIQHGDRLAMAPTSGNTGTATLIPSNTKAFKKTHAKRIALPEHPLEWHPTWHSGGSSNRSRQYSRAKSIH